MKFKLLIGGHSGFGRQACDLSVRKWRHFKVITHFFSSFFFARHNTKIPFYISLASVAINILISVSLFNRFGFIIIPISTSIASWFNALLLYFFMIKKNFFIFNDIFKFRFPRIIFSTIIMGIIFYLLLNQFSFQLNYNQNYKFFYLLLNIFIALITYILISFFTKASKFSDIKIR